LSLTPAANVPVHPKTVGAQACMPVVLYDGSGNVVSSFGGSGGTAQNDQTAFTAGASALTPVGGLYETVPSSVGDGEVGVLGITPKRSAKVTLYDSSGVEITSFGGGIQYTQGDSDSTPTGTAAMAKDSSDVLKALAIDANNDLLVRPRRGSVATLSNVNDAAVSATLLAANADRLKVMIYNDSTAALYIKYGVTASATSFTILLLPGGFHVEEHYTGRIDGIWASDASGAARITEVTTA
jgi:hypothetical protein